MGQAISLSGDYAGTISLRCSERGLAITFELYTTPHFLLNKLQHYARPLNKQLSNASFSLSTETACPCTPFG